MPKEAECKTYSLCCDNSMLVNISIWAYFHLVTFKCGKYKDCGLIYFLSFVCIDAS